MRLKPFILVLAIFLPLAALVPTPAHIRIPSPYNAFGQSILSPILFGGPGPVVAHWQTVSMDPTQAGTADTANYVATIIITGQTYLKTIGNGGDVASSSCFDCQFFSDAGFTTKMKWETEFYDGTAGTGVFHVQVNLSHTSNPNFYFGFGNASITTFQGNVNGTWDSNYVLVSHLPNGTTPSFTDSTINGNNGTNHGMTALAGQIDGAVTTVNGADYASYLNPSTLQISGSITMEAWINQFSGFSAGRIVSKMVAGGWTGYELDTQDGLNWSMLLGSSGGTLRQAGGNATQTNGTWYYFVGVYNGTTGTVYVNNVAQSTTISAASAIGSNTQNFILGRRSDLNNAFSGFIDEVRISNIARTTSYLTATYNNTKTGSTFITLGTVN